MRTLIYSFLLWTVAASGSSRIIEIGNHVEPKDLDPQRVSGIQEEHLLNQLFEGLYMLDPKTLQPVPGVALSHVLSGDGRTYTFTLRKDAKWSNGDPVTAYDFVYAWRRLADPKTGSENVHHAWLLKNGKKLYDEKATNFTSLGVEAGGAHTLVVTLEEPVAYFPKLLEHFSLSPLHRATIEKHGDKWTKAENFVGNGAFRLDKWENYKVISLKKSETYWDKANVALDGANIYPVEDMDAEEQLFRTKKLDVTANVPLEKIPSWQNDKTGVFQNHPYFSVYFFRLNTRKPPLDNPKVRRALALAIDREQIAKHVLKGGQLPATCYTPPELSDVYSCKNIFPAKAAVKEAQKLLAEAGYPGGKKFPSGVELIFNTADIHKKIAEAVQQMWKKNLGIDIPIANREWKVLLENVGAGNYYIARGSWTGDVIDPVTFLNLWQSDNGKNQTGYSNLVYDGLLIKASKERGRKKRAEILLEAERIAGEGTPAIPLYVYTRSYLVQPEVKNWPANILGKWYLKSVSLDRKTMKGSVQ